MYQSGYHQRGSSSVFESRRDLLVSSLLFSSIQLNILRISLLIELLHRTLLPPIYIIPLLRFCQNHHPQTTGTNSLISPDSSRGHGKFRDSGAISCQSPFATTSTPPSGISYRSPSTTPSHHNMSESFEPLQNDLLLRAARGISLLWN